VCEPAELKRRPRTAIAGKFSIYYTLATVLLDRRVDFASYSNEALTRAEVLALADKVNYRVEPAILNGEVLEVRMRDGTVHRRSVRAVYGSTAAPLPIEALIAKFVDCGSHAMRARSTAELHRIAASVLSIEQTDNVRSLLSQLSILAGYRMMLTRAGLHSLNFLLLISRLDKRHQGYRL
jgi:2-methylcitrate dehydratase PrpD